MKVVSMVSFLLALAVTIVALTKAFNGSIRFDGTVRFAVAQVLTGVISTVVSLDCPSEERNAINYLGAMGVVIGIGGAVLTFAFSFAALFSRGHGWGP